MIYKERKITKTIYDNAMQNHGYIQKKDYNKIFSISEILGYGIYGAKAYENNGTYYCRFYRGETCD